MNIQAQVSANKKNWFGKVTGLSGQYGVDVEFLPAVHENGSVKRYEITEPGVYKHPETTTILSMRRDTGYVRVDTKGGVTEISAAEAKEWAAKI